MSKKILVKFVILLVVGILVYSAFWFFKVSQVEKRIRNFIDENIAHASSGEITTSGFPLTQKITVKNLKVSIPNPAFSKYQIVIAELEAKAGILESDFVVTLSKVIKVQDLGGDSAVVKFNQDPKIMVSIADGRISKLNYQDSGYKIIGEKQNTLYSAVSSLVTVVSSFGDDDKITTKVMVDVKEMEGFNIIDVYKNAFEKKITEGIKTGEIVLGHTIAEDDNQELPIAENENQELAIEEDSLVESFLEDLTEDDSSEGVDSESLSQNPTDLAQVVSVLPVEPIKPAESIKSNLIATIEYILSPNSNEQQAQIPLDPTQIQEISVQYSKVIKIVNLEFSNPLFKILMNGKMNSVIDDNMLFGALSIKVQKIDDLTSHIVADLDTMIEERDIAIGDSQIVESIDGVLSTNDPYSNFLEKIADGLEPISLEIAAQNVVSKEEIAQFDIRREKNLEFLVNETPLREVLGKF